MFTVQKQAEKQSVGDKLGTGQIRVSPVFTRFLFLCICILFIVRGLLKKSISRLWLQLGFQQIQDPLLIGFRNGDWMEFGSCEMDLLSANGRQA